MHRDRKTRTFLFFFAGLGFIDAVYLTWVKLAHNNQAFCLPGLGDCFTVNNSRYSVVFGIPVSILGAGAYLAILVLLWAEPKVSIWRVNSQIAIFGISTLGLFFSGYLTYIEIIVIKAICPFCVISAVLMLLVFCLSLVRYLFSNQTEDTIH